MTPTLFPIIFAVLLLIGETKAPLFTSAPESRSIHIARNIGITLFNALTYGIMYGLALGVVGNMVASNGWGVMNVVSLPLWMEGLVLFLLFDLLLYWWHVANHMIPFLWKFHQVHHSDILIDVSSATRFHGGELFISALLRLSFILLTGATISQIAFIELVVVLFAQFNHANLKLSAAFERALRVMIVTPAMHHIHHSTDPKETNSNYCTTLSWWDYLFGSYRWNSSISKISIGLDQYKKHQVTFVKLLFMPWRRKKSKVS